MQGMTRSFGRAMRLIGSLCFYSLCALGVVAGASLLFSGSSTMYDIAKTTTVVKDVLDRFEPSMVFAPCTSGDTTTTAQCAVQNGYEFSRDDYGYRISLASDPDRTPIITFATRDSLNRITTARFEFDLKKFSRAFSRAAHETLAI